MGLKLRCLRCNSTRLRKYTKGAFVKNGVAVLRCFDCNRFVTMPEAAEAAAASREAGLASDAGAPSVSDASSSLPSSSLPSTPRAATPALQEPAQPAKAKAKKRGSMPPQRR